MPKKKSSSSAIETALVDSIDHLNDSVQRLTKRSRAIVESSKSYGIYFLRGVMYGLGFLFAFVIVIPLIVWMLQYIEWIPMLGDLIVNIIERIEEVSKL
ncbi:MAG: DUF5665 domain-containing protein [Candidatus Peribacteraceae bacterium]|jgi:Sec-independent protein secretion pathway component TatC|nr:DUF5665 domain-containing protein [Candidatus Peribacteraceae bacterium]MDP7454718.1 DUF5665 domain-containing protein [Candidatus Peribacteraceae bacterium]|tara:strand:- start:234 stop:530 length:297 start_codon:yes stop_codon:yes gene_type:complete